MSSKKSIINKIGFYDTSIVWIFLVIYLVVLLVITPGVILKILPFILIFCCLLSLLIFWRGRENARRVLDSKFSTFRTIFEGGLIGTFTFLFLILFFTYKLVKTPESLWNDNEIFKTALQVLFLTILFGFLTGALGSFVIEKFNKIIIKKLTN
jgi:membrane protease YdiL (CAAX protease family)